MCKYSQAVHDEILKDNELPEKDMRLSLINVHLGMTMSLSPEAQKLLDGKKVFTVCKVNESKNASAGKGKKGTVRAPTYFTAPEFEKHIALIAKSSFLIGESKTKNYFEHLLCGSFGPWESVTVCFSFFFFIFF